MMTLTFLATAWLVTAGFALVLFAAAKNAARRTETMLVVARVPERPRRRSAA